ncbi:endonuclease domain-containing protein [Agromyces sp. NPDC058126]|uniref:endonuclease domain-containing protein n=1 Tax=Agromyces sp. NPDC058126 TaxID=3346350 RepID=UPI0036DCB9C3
MSNDSRHVALWIRGHGGAVPLRSLDAAGLRREQVQAAVAEEAVVRLRRGWYSVPDAPDEVVRAVRVGGAATAASVARIEGLWVQEDPQLHVRVPRTASRLKSPRARTCGRAQVPLDAAGEGVCVHYRSDPRAVSGRDGLALALAEMLRCSTPEAAIATIDSALARRLVGLDDVRAVASPAFHRTLARCAAGSESGLETRVRLLLRAYNIRHRTQVSIPGVGRVDLLVGDRLVVEVDGARFHSGVAEFENDRRRDFELAMRGYRVLRLSYRMVMEEWATTSRGILALVERGEHRWGGRSAPSSGIGVALRGLDRHDDAPPVGAFSRGSSH